MTKVKPTNDHFLNEKTITKRDAIKQAELSTAKRIGIKEGLEKGIEQGIEKGMLEGKLEIIKSMIRAGYSYDQVNEIPPLTKEEYDILRSNL